jgi:hypothetical protein
VTTKMTDLLKFAEANGFTYTGVTTSRNHLIYVNEASGVRVTLSCSPGTCGSVNQTKAKIRRKAREATALLASRGQPGPGEAAP